MINNRNSNNQSDHIGITGDFLDYNTGFDGNFDRIASSTNPLSESSVPITNTNTMPTPQVSIIDYDFPIRVTIMTLNLWGDNYWPERQESLSQLLLTTKPDILFVQEATPEIITFIEKMYINHHRVKDENVKGWTTEGNIFWDSRLFTCTDYGADSLELKDYPNRCLFWARLRVLAKPSLTLFTSTVHFPWQGCDREIDTGVNCRISCCYKVCEVLRRYTAINEPIILGGDFNDDFHPLRILNEEMALIDIFELVDLPPPITHPVRPSDPREESRPNRTLDWIVCALPSQARVTAAYAKQVRGGRRAPPSDHLPVIGFFELTEIKDSKTNKDRVYI